jgi:DNA-directed RNA polymerase specialized sigma24 family protein
MGGTENSSGRAGLVPDGAEPRRGSPGGKIHGGAPRDGAEPAARQALNCAYAAHYCSLLRLAALLTGDVTAAESVTAAAFAALYRAPGGARTGNRTLLYLRREVVTRSRHPARHRRGQHHSSQHHRSQHHSSQHHRGELDAGPQHGARQDQSRANRGFERAPVVVALRALSPAEREAVVLTLYLHLTEREAAAVTGSSQALLRRRLAAAMPRLRAGLAGTAAADRAAS